MAHRGVSQGADMVHYGMANYMIAHYGQQMRESYGISFTCMSYSTYRTVY